MLPVGLHGLGDTAETIAANTVAPLATRAANAELSGFDSDTLKTIGAVSAGDSWPRAIAQLEMTGELSVGVRINFC